MNLNFKKLFLLFLPLFFLLPISVHATEEDIDGATLFTYQSTVTDGTSFLKGINGIIYPKGAQKIDKLYIFFHGLNPTTPPTPCDNCHLIDPSAVCKEFKFCQKVSWQSTKENIAILIPQMDPKSGNNAKNFTEEKFNDYLREALIQLHLKIPASPFSASVIMGHSAGVGIMKEYIKYFEPVTAIMFDGCYGNWCEELYGPDSPTKNNFFYLTTKTDKTSNHYGKLNGYIIFHPEDRYKILPKSKVFRFTADHYSVPEKCFLDHITDDNCNSKPLDKPPETKLDVLLSEINAKKPKLEINFPGLNFSDSVIRSDGTGTYVFIPWIAQFISALYKFGVGITSIIAVVIIILQGARIIISGGGEHKAEGYKKITHSLIGLLIAWGSFAILYNINPNLVEFNALKVKVVEREELPVSASEEESIDLSDTQGTGNIPYFGQYDKKWRDLKPGDQDWPYNGACSAPASILQRGCGPTSLAMVLKYLGKSVTPIETARASLGCSGAMSSADLKDNWLKTPWSDLKFEYLRGEKALETASKGAPLIFNCHPCVGYNGEGKLKSYPGHYMVITGSTDGGQTFTINDPGGNPKINRAIIKMTREQILSPQKEQAIEGCQTSARCIKGIDIIRVPSFIYIHK